MIGAGRVLLLAGAEADLASLPEGCWIGGTVGHFVTPQGGVAAGGLVYYVDFTDIASSAACRRFDAGDIHEISRFYPENGFTILILPGFSRLLGEVALHIMEYDGLYNMPLMGWVSAVALKPLEAEAPEEVHKAEALDAPGAQARPKVFAGGPVAQDERAAALYIGLPEQNFAQLQIANLFSPGAGPEIRFAQPGQDIAGDCLIGGMRGNLARYMAEHNIDPRLPLVADHEGALLNVSILSADAESGRVVFLSPVSPALSYRFAEEITDYEAEFARAAAETELERAAHACICALHFRHAGSCAEIFRQRRGPDVIAPVTFGQIAYTVLNQTLACLTIGQSEEEEDFAP